MNALFRQPDRIDPVVEALDPPIAPPRRIGVDEARRAPYCTIEQHAWLCIPSSWVCDCGSYIVRDRTDPGDGLRH